MKSNGVMVLADGTVFAGKLIGVPEEPVVGEAVFNTGMVGYQEVLTDPSYAGQIVTMTFPVIGNYGVEPDSAESARVQARALVARELWNEAEQRGSRRQLAAYLYDYGVPALTSLDTRALTRHLRQHGAMKAVIGSTEHYSVAELSRFLTQAPDFGSLELISRITCTKPVWHRTSHPVGQLAVIDLGLKKGILQTLVERGYSVAVLPPTTTPQDILQLNVDGVLFSNGPGNPEVLTDQIKLAKALIGKIPVFGICLGHQIMALAMGAQTYKLKFGHRGANHPVRDLGTGHIYITAQNHGYAVAEEGLAEAGLVVTHRSLNDGTVEGLSHQYLPLSSVQFHPEASPGPLDAAKLLNQFMSQVQRARAC